MSRERQKLDEAKVLYEKACTKHVTEQLQFVEALSLEQQQLLYFYCLYQNILQLFKFSAQQSTTGLVPSTFNYLYSMVENSIEQQHHEDNVTVDWVSSSCKQIISKLMSVIREEARDVFVFKEGWLQLTTLTSRLKNLGKSDKFSKQLSCFEKLLPNGQLLPLYEACGLLVNGEFVYDFGGDSSEIIKMLRTQKVAVEKLEGQILSKIKSFGLDKSKAGCTFLFNLLNLPIIYYMFSPSLIESWYLLYENRYPTAQLNLKLLTEKFQFLRYKDNRTLNMQAQLAINKIFTVPHQPLQHAPEYTYQFIEDDIARLLLTLRFSFLGIHHHRDHSVAIEFREGLSNKIWHDHVISLLGKPPISDNSFEFCFKQLPILTNYNRCNLSHWCKEYNNGKKIVLYGIVHLGGHWVPYFILQHKEKPLVLTFEPLHVKDKAESVRSLYGFFTTAFDNNTALFEFKNVDNYDGQYNNYPCGAVSFYLLYDIFSSLASPAPVLTYEDNKFKCYPQRLKHNGYKWRSQGKGDYEIEFFYSTDRVVSTVKQLIAQFDKAALMSIGSSIDDNDHYKVQGVETYCIVEGDSFDIKVLRLKLKDVVDEIVSQLCGMIQFSSTSAVPQLTDEQIDAMLANSDQNLVIQFVEISKLIEGQDNQVIYTSFRAALFRQWEKYCIDQSSHNLIVAQPRIDSSKARICIKNCIASLKTYPGIDSTQFSSFRLFFNAITGNVYQSEIRSLVSMLENQDTAITIKLEEICRHYLLSPSNFCRDKLAVELFEYFKPKERSALCEASSIVISLRNIFIVEQIKKLFPTIDQPDMVTAHGLRPIN